MIKTSFIILIALINNANTFNGVLYSKPICEDSPGNVFFTLRIILQLSVYLHLAYSDRLLQINTWAIVGHPSSETTRVHFKMHLQPETKP